MACNTALPGITTECQQDAAPHLVSHIDICWPLCSMAVAVQQLAACSVALKLKVCNKSLSPGPSWQTSVGTPVKKAGATPQSPRYCRRFVTLLSLDRRYRQLLSCCPVAVSYAYRPFHLKLARLGPQRSPNKPSLVLAVMQLGHWRLTPGAGCACTPAAKYDGEHAATLVAPAEIWHSRVYAGAATAGGQSLQ
jgi:hypothetical protein